MNPVNDKILVRVNPNQKESFEINGSVFSTALKWETNYREKSPTVCEVVKGNTWVKEGDMLLTHHNLFYLPSPYHLQDDLFAVPASAVLFCIVKPDGELQPIYGNIICQTLDVQTVLPLPPEYRKKEINRCVITNQGDAPYQKGDLIFHRPHAWYEIVYTWNGELKRVVKVHESQICGVVRN